MNNIIYNFHFFYRYVNSTKQLWSSSSHYWRAASASTGTGIPSCCHASTAFVWSRVWTALSTTSGDRYVQYNNSKTTISYILTSVVVSLIIHIAYKSSKCNFRANWYEGKMLYFYMKWCMVFSKVWMTYYFVDKHLNLHFFTGEMSRMPCRAQNPIPRCSGIPYKCHSPEVFGTSRKHRWRASRPNGWASNGKMQCMLRKGVLCSMCPLRQKSLRRL